MKIKGIHIYGFGKLENLMIDDLSSGLHVIMGENEAGKSTIMAFIHAILFGFPAKNQLDSRYEPKKGASYGGKLIVESRNGHSYTIERVAGKQAGDVTVINDLGHPCSLDELLDGIDKNMFKAIFSFNIMDVQNVKLIDSDELGSFLFSSGIIGNDKLHRLSQELTKEQEELFKPGGRKPVMNKLLADLKEEQRIVWQWEEKLACYEKLQVEAKQLENRLSETKERKLEAEKSVKLIDTLLSIQPIHDKKERVKIELERMEGFNNFPRDPIARLEKWQTEKNFYLTKFEKIKSDMVDCEQMLKNLSVDDLLLAKAGLMEELVAERPRYDQMKERLAVLETEREGLEKQIALIKQELNWQQLDSDSIQSFDSSIPSKAEMKELYAKNQALSNQKKRLDDEFKVLKDELEKQEVRVNTLEEELLPTDEIQRMESLVSKQNLDSVSQDVKLTDQLISQLEKQMEYQEQENVSKQGRAKIIALSAIVIGIACSSYFFIQNNIFIAVVMLVFALVFTALNIKPSTANTSLKRMKDEYQDLKTKRDRLKEKLYASDVSATVEEYKARLSKQKSVIELLQKERLLLTQCERAYNRNIEQFEEWEKESFHIEERWERWAKVRSLEHISLSFIEEAFEKAVLLRQSISNLEALKSKINHLQQACQEFQTKVSQLVAGVDELEHGITIEDALPLMRSKLNKEMEKRQQSQKIKQELEALENESRELSVQYSGADKQIQLLFEQAQVEDEEQYRLKSEQYVVSLELEKEYTLLSSQLEHLLKLYQVSYTEHKPLEVWKAEKVEQEKLLRDLKQQEQELIENRTAVKETIRQLEEEGSYSDAVQQVELSKGKLQQYARKWAVYATAQQMLLRTIEFYRDVKLPKVLEQATKHFQYLTGGKYTRIIDNEEHRKLYVQHQDGTVFAPKELSQATIEQLFISIRLAVASVWGEQQFPFIIDDSFVNFDELRTEQAISLLEKLADNGEQIMFFTCHSHIKNLFAIKSSAMIHTIDESEKGKVTLWS
ncbi:hypothetical protein FIU87_06340 [Bacillus sp. THAF10]|uniref:ATP-binding protein n=1 Tax=Bacillus sp. THAF10 TaxID=2587848 RepID=UPI0012A91E45|nr:AAA family ATPase [Bacillus sp. THAF10]QFT88254.1 hypothetical protein FIU87_06340 [Bacillus sp. THAF10]